ncbi:uncharacterized protein LOC144100719 [Amblyomma americanum]
MAAGEIDGALNVLINGQLTTLRPVVDENGARARQGEGFAYATPDGEIVCAVVRDTTQTAAPPVAPSPPAESASASPAPMAPSATVAPTAASPAAQVYAAVGPTPDERPGSPDSDLWNGPKARFLISKYNELKENVGRKGGFRQVTLHVYFIDRLALSGHSFA